MTRITPQYQAYNSAPLTYAAVSSNDLIHPLTGAMVLHIFNAGETDDLVIFHPSCTSLPGHATTPCTVVSVEAGGEVLIGPFDYVAYEPSLTVRHTATTDVYIAAFFSELIITETAIALATETPLLTVDVATTEAGIAIATEVAAALYSVDVTATEAGIAIATEALTGLAFIPLAVTEAGIVIATEIAIASFGGIIPRHHDITGIIHADPRCAGLLRSGVRHVGLLELDMAVDT